MNYVLDADTKGFFDNLDKSWLVKFVEHRVADPRILRLIQKWLKAGVMEDGKWSEPQTGSPQGAVISPLLANIYLHYTFDLWVNAWRKKKAQGGSEAYFVAAKDVNGDGKPDILVANHGSGTVGVLLANGNGTFQPAVTYEEGGNSPFSIAVDDVNSDGKPDLLVGNGSSTVGVLLGNGNGTFQAAEEYDSGGAGQQSVAVADVNGDGRPDVIAANFEGPGGGLGNVGVLLNNTASDTTPPVITLSATPKVLWPPNGKMVPVTVSGTITDTGSGVNVDSAAYAVKDEYGEVQPHGAITLGPGGAYSFTILLQASRLGSDLDGRRYKVTIRAKDNAGNGGSKTSVVTVPHDQRD